MSGSEREGIQGGDKNLNLNKQGDGHEHHDPFLDVRGAGGADRVAKAGDSTNDSPLEKEAANPAEGFMASQQRFGEKLASADPVAKEMAGPVLQETADHYTRQASQNFGEGAAAFVASINNKMITGQSVDIASETKLG